MNFNLNVFWTLVVVVIGAPLLAFVLVWGMFMVALIAGYNRDLVAALGVGDATANNIRSRAMRAHAQTSGVPTVVFRNRPESKSVRVST